MRFRIGAEDECRVVGNVQPLVRVRDPGVRPLDAAQERPELRAGGGPEPERTVDVQPGAVLRRQVGDLAE